MEKILYPNLNILLNRIKFIFAMDSSINVGELVQSTENPNVYSLSLYTCNMRVAVAIRKILPQSYSVDNLIINLIVIGPNCKEIDPPKVGSTYTSQEVIKLFCNSLYYNKLYKGIMVIPENSDIPELASKIVVLINPYIFSYYTNNSNNIYGDTTEIATDSFCEVFLTSFYTELTPPSKIDVIFNTYNSCKCDPYNIIYTPDYYYNCCQPFDNCYNNQYSYSCNYSWNNINSNIPNCPLSTPNIPNFPPCLNSRPGRMPSFPSPNPNIAKFRPCPNPRLNRTSSYHVPKSNPNSNC